MHRILYIDKEACLSLVKIDVAHQLKLFTDATAPLIQLILSVLSVH